MLFSVKDAAQWLVCLGTWSTTLSVAAKSNMSGSALRLLIELQAPALNKLIEANTKVGYHG